MGKYKIKITDGGTHYLMCLKNGFNNKFEGIREGAALEGGQESNRIGSFATENPAAPSMKGSVKLT